MRYYNPLPSASELPAASTLARKSAAVQITTNSKLSNSDEIIIISSSLAWILAGRDDDGESGLAADAPAANAADEDSAKSVHAL